MKQHIRELWGGSLYPIDKPVSTPELKEATLEIKQFKAKLFETLNEDQQELFTEYEELLHNKEAYCEEAGFIKGFSLGVSLISEAFSE